MPRWFGALRKCLGGGSISGVLLGCFAYLSFSIDETRLGETARSVTSVHKTTSEKTLALLDWVHRIPETRENRRFFLLRGLRATPVQVLESGGDCADKSRLLTALLGQVGIRATMVMCYDPRTESPTHTVVCAFQDDGGTMIVDPAYGLYFPDPAANGFFGLAEMRANPSVLEDRVAALRASSPRSHPVHSYNVASTGYSLASSVHWNKNALSRLARRFLLPVWGEDLYSVPRPRFVEEPKLFVAYAAFGSAGALWASSLLAKRFLAIAASVRSVGANPHAETAWRPVSD